MLQVYVYRNPLRILCDGRDYDVRTICILGLHTALKSFCILLTLIRITGHRFLLALLL